MASRSIARIEHNDSDLRFRDKVNSNFAALASDAGMDAATIQLIADSKVIADIMLALNTRLAPGDILAGAGISVQAGQGQVTITNEVSLVKTRFTPEGGFAIRLINGTGSVSVKGSLVACSPVDDDAFVLQNNEYDSIGAVYESGVANGQPCWVVVSGIAEVLLENGRSVVNGDLAIAAVTDGRAIGIANPGNGLPATNTHFKEIGHFIQARPSGTDVLARIVMHFN